MAAFRPVLTMDAHETSWVVRKDSDCNPHGVVTPAALAAAEMAAAQAGAFLDAVVRGYESQIRIGVAVRPGHYANWQDMAA